MAEVFVLPHMLRFRRRPGKTRTNWGNRGDEGHLGLIGKFAIGDKVTWIDITYSRTGDIIGKNEKQSAVIYIDKYGREKITAIYYKEMTIILK